MEVLEKEKPTKFIKKQVAKIVPYLDGKSENMGLAAYKMVLFEGANYEEQLTYLDSGNGIRRYLTGLDENAPEVQNIDNEDAKKAAIKMIREKVAFIERSINATDLKLDDPDFWSKVKTVHPTNYVFWDKIFVRPGNEPVFLDPKNSNDLITISCIEAGGFSSVGKSFEDARRSSVAPKFYLDRDVDTSSSKTEIKKIKNKAFATLDELFTKEPTKLFYVVKVIDDRSDRYKLSTSQDTIYAFLDSFITGHGTQNAKKAAMKFNEVCALPLDDLKVRAVVADATFYKMLTTKQDGMIYYSKPNVMLGRNIEDVIAFLKEDLHAKTWEELLAEVEVYWKN